MSSISSLKYYQLVLLALKSHLSLPLRWQWQRETKRDPLNDIVWTMCHKAVGRISSWIIGITIVGAFLYTSLVQFHFPIAFEWFKPYFVPSTYALFGFPAAVLIVGIGLECRASFVARLESAREFAEHLTKVLVWLAKSKEDVHQTAKWVAYAPFAELRRLAKERLIIEARKVAAHSATHTGVHVPEWHLVHDEITGRFKEMYAVFRRFDLVHGEEYYFLDEGRKANAKTAAEKPFDVGACLDKAREMGANV